MYSKRGKMTKVGAQGIKLTDKLNGTRGNKRNIHIVNNGQREDFTWFDVNQLSDKYAWILHKHGRMAKTAAIIGMYSKQSMAWFIACCKLGNANCLLEPDYPDRFGILNDIEVDFVFIDKKYMKGDIRLEEYPSIKYIFWLNGGDAAHAEAGEIFPCESSSPEIISLDAEKWNNAEINESKKTVRTYSEEHTTIDTILTFASTSGSTGPPKILEYPNRFMGEFPIYTKDLQKKSDIFKLCCTFGCGRCIKMAKGKNNLGGVLNFVGHIMFNVVNYLSTARELNFTLLDRYDLEGNLLHIKEAPVNTLVLYLPMLLDLIRTKSFRTSGINVQAIQVTGALMTPEIYTNVRDAFKKAHFDPPEIFSAYGSTELGSIVFRPGLFDSTWVKQNTVGRINPAPGYDFRIRDIETEEIKWTASEGIKNGVENGGEIEILSPIRMRGYRGKETIEWHRMGDIAHFERDCLKITGRIKEQMSLYNGKKVNAANIEDRIRNSYLCSEVAVAAERNDNGYDTCHVFVRGEKQQESKLHEWAKEHLQDEQPKFHFRTDELDRLASGKYDRKGMMAKLQ